VKSGEIFFLTICCENRRTNQLAEPAAFGLMTEALERYVQIGRFWVHLFLAMPDHLHALVAFPSDQSMEKVLRDWKRFVAKRTDIIWQDGFFDRRLRQEESLVQKTDYIRMNPVRAGLVATPGEWKYVWLPGDAAAAR
jgi:REP element-mobilizing transposase RayT